MQFNITLCNHITPSTELKHLIKTAVAGVTLSLMLDLAFLCIPFPFPAGMGYITIVCLYFFQTSLIPLGERVFRKSSLWAH